MKFKLAFFLAVLGVALTAVAVYAVSNISYPIAELGNCSSRAACEQYCDTPANIDACLNFAERQGLMSKQEVQTAKNMTRGMAINGPGGCKNERACRAYCDNTGNMLECLEFALANDIVPAGELGEARQVLQALKAGARPPGGCGSKALCEAYCDNPDNVSECIDFALAAGFMSRQEADMVRKTGGRGPGGCRGEAQCDAYCESGDHMLECMEFALQYDLVPAAEAAEMRQAMKALKVGAKLPNCRGEAECEVYCSEPAHLEECVSFATAAGFMSAEDAARVRRMGTMSGPGGCKGDECETYCDDPAHMEACIDFAVRAGEMSSADAERIKKMGTMGGPGGCKGDECETYCDDPSHADECLDFAVRMGEMSAEEAEQIKRDLAAGHKPGEEGPPSLGGCGSQEECLAYCQNPANAQECLQFAVGTGQISQEEAAEMINRAR